MQIEIKKEKLSRTQRDNEIWHHRVVERVKRLEEDEDRKAAELKKKALQAKTVQLEQLDEFKTKFIQDKLVRRAPPPPLFGDADPGLGRPEGG